MIFTFGRCKCLTTFIVYIHLFLNVLFFNNIPTCKISNLRPDIDLNFYKEYQIDSSASH